jgi:hypothetical protein
MNVQKGETPVSKNTFFNEKQKKGRSESETLNEYNERKKRGDDEGACFHSSWFLFFFFFFFGLTKDVIFLQSCLWDT